MNQLNFTVIYIAAFLEIIVFAYWWFFVYRKEKNKVNNLIKEKIILEKEKENIEREKDETEVKNAEKSFKFIAINQMAKTLAKEKNTRALKKLILDMLLETNSVIRGFSMHNTGDMLEVFEFKGMERKNCDFKIYKNKNMDLWNKLRDTRVWNLKELKNYPELSNILTEFKDGFWISFVTSIDETDSEDITFTVFLGEKAYGEYSDDEEEFLDTLCGQIEIVLENCLKNAYIKEKNEELNEKVYNLTILNNASEMVSSTLDMDEIFDKSIDMFAEVSRADKAMAVYYDKESEQLEVKGIRGKFIKNPGLVGTKIKIEKEDLEFLRDLQNIILITELEPSFTMKLKNIYDKYESIFKAFKHEILIPLIGKDDFLGMILLGMRAEDGLGYKEDNIEVYSTLGRQIAISLSNAKLYSLAITDGMTKLYLHRYFKVRLFEELERAKRYERQVSLLMTDIDHFKKFNDTYGHQTGDKVLKEVATIIKESVRKTDIAARYGGEEFAIVLPETGEEGTKKVAENIRKKIEAHEIINEGQVLKVTISIGAYTYKPNESNDDVELIIKKADKALYYSKKTGRNRVTHFEQIKGYIDDEEIKH